MAHRQRHSAIGWLNYCVWIMALWASLFNLLNFNNYPLLRPEVGLAMIGLALVGLCMGHLQKLSQPRLWAAVTGLFAVLLIDLNTSLTVAWFFGLWVGIGLIAFYAKELFSHVVFASASAVLLFQATGALWVSDVGDKSPNQVLNLQDERRPAANRPAIVHLVLDSYLGLDGMALGPNIYRSLRSEQSAFFLGHGFQVYPRAYSPHSKTLNSLPALFSYGGEQPFIHKVSGSYTIPEQLPYFADLNRLGYRIEAHIPAYFDLCVKQKLAECETFQSSHLSSMLGTELRAVDRAKVFAFTMLNLTHVTRLIVNSIRPDPAARFAFNRSELFPVTSLRELDKFIDDLPNLRRGEVRFGHFLLPHDPYMLAADCSVKPESQWLDEHGPGAAAVREKSYADQVNCLQQRLEQLFDALGRSSAGREAIVLLHGDHGSRIAPSQPMVDGPVLSKRELLMSYSTFFAIRVPAQAPGEIEGTYALDQLMADFRARDFLAAPRPSAEQSKVSILGSSGEPLAGGNLPHFIH